jgi:hypothetical protein
LKIVNKSSKRVRDLRPLSDFVAKRCRHSHMAHLVVGELPDHVFANGHAWQREGEDPTAPSRVTVDFGCEMFPKKVKHQGNPPVVVTSAEEEFVVVLAHELRHIDQFWDGKLFERDADAESDAELFAHQILDEYRREKAQKAA